jgi:ABC-type multidrug transport system fused ATPase/permease subunit
LKAILRLWPYFRRGWPYVLLSLIQIVVVALLSLAAPLIIRWVVDHVLAEGNWRYLAPGALAIVGVALLAGVLRFSMRWCMEMVTQRMIADLRARLYEHLQQLSFGFYDKARTGELMSRVTADVDTLRQAFGWALVNGLMHFGGATFTIAAMFVLDWQMALVGLLYLPFLIRAMGRFSKEMTPAWLGVQDQTAMLSAVIQENVSGIRVVRAFAREKEEIAKFRQENDRFQLLNLDAIRTMAYWNNYMNFLTAVGAVAILWYGGLRVMDGLMTVGTLIAFNTYVMNLVNPIRMVGFMIAIWSRAGAGAQRIFELLDTRSEVEEKPDARPLGRARGEVRLENLSFAYAGGGTVLDGVTMHARPGERIAILGMTGSGKSTVINLIPRFYDPTEGQVLIDGHDIRELTLDSLRKNIAMVMQESFLFSTTLRENIAYGRPGARMEEIIAAAEAAQIHDFIMSLPDRYETVVGERGVGLSGGQKQRVAIARALLMDAPILIMDESTSAVDVRTEHLIQEAMDRVMVGRTSFIIAQRLSTIMNADRVVVLDEGRVAEEGTHEQLIARGGLYGKIYDLQLKPAEEARLERLKGGRTA